MNTNKLLLSKWTAVAPQNREKHFIVTAVVAPEEPGAAVEWVELEAVYSGISRRIAWRALGDTQVWRQGWV